MTQAFDVTDPLGADLLWGDDLDPTHRLVSGAALLVQDVYHRITTPRGALIDDPDYGIDVRAYLHRGMTPEEIAATPNQIAAEIRKDERVEQVAVSLAEDRPGAWRITIRGVAAAGPFGLVVGVGDAGPQLLAGAA